MLNNCRIATDISITEILRSASDALDGPQALAHLLGVTKSDLQAWLEGEQNLPFDIAVRVLEISSAAHTAWPFPSAPTGAVHLPARAII